MRWEKISLKVDEKFYRQRILRRKGSEKFQRLLDLQNAETVRYLEAEIILQKIEEICIHSFLSPERKRKLFFFISHVCKEWKTEFFRPEEKIVFFNICELWSEVIVNIRDQAMDQIELSNHLFYLKPFNWL